jgi:hypothetical protein
MRILMPSDLGSRHRSDGVYEQRPAAKEEPKGNGVLFRRIWPTECQGLCASIRRSSGVEASLHSRTSKFPIRPVSQDRVHFSDGSAFTPVRYKHHLLRVCLHGRLMYRTYASVFRSLVLDGRTPSTARDDNKMTTCDNELMIQMNKFDIAPIWMSNSSRRSSM